MAQRVDSLLRPYVSFVARASWISAFHAFAAVMWLGFVGSAVAQGLSPEAAVKAMTVADGLEVRVVAAEPLVRQPVCIEFDDRGRLWVIQYLQYPNPEGLQRVQVDRFSRTKYDRVPDPPPKGPRGADRITILEDADGDGRMDRGRDFVNGLNLATGLAFGHGGVFVLNVPYLLFYPDRNRDDVPDDDPEVLLAGFGMEDAHSVANSLTWGPDGWLYGCQGSTVTANIRGVEFQQGVWRYHPTTREFELFCEGGGNAWGLDFDRHGRLLYSTNYGGFVLVHGVKGGYYVKSFAKHGALHNPHSYGYFDHAPHAGFRGGHVTVGGIVYQADALPATYRDRYLAGDLLGHGAYWHQIEPHGSTVRTVHGGELLTANDPWFAPTDVTTGPDGAVYIADWHDARTAHPDPDAEWDRSNGRIYRLAVVGTPLAKPRDYATLSVDELLALHGDRNQWHVRRARQELVRRNERTVAEALKTRALTSPTESPALEALWTIASLGSFDESLADRLLDSPHEWVRAWTVRLLGDAKSVSPTMAPRLDHFAEQEPSVHVRQQLACTAARLPAAQALPIINAHINRDLDRHDPYLPLLWWWAVEQHSVTGREEVLKRFVRPTLWKSHLGREVLLPRLVRRYAAEGTTDGCTALVRLLNAVPDAAARDTLWPSLLIGLKESTTAATTIAAHRDLTDRILARFQTLPDNVALLEIALRLGHPAAREAALKTALDPQQPAKVRIERWQMLGGFLDEKSTAQVLMVLKSEPSEPVRVAALQAVSRVNSPTVAAALVEFSQSPGSEAWKSQLRQALFGRASSTRVWLQAVDRGVIDPKTVPLDDIRRIALLNDAELDAAVVKHWGRLQNASREEKLAEVRRLNNDVRAAPGDVAAGQAVYKKHCAACHQLFGEGTKLGPDLTTANRRDREFLLVSLVDPSSVVRKEFLSHVVHTRDGRVLTGLAVSRDDAAVTLADAKNQRITVPLVDIDELHESPVSLMPDDLYRQLKPYELRDLFAYLQSKP